MGIRFVHNVHFRDKLKRIRPDQWVTGSRKALWWLGYLIQIGCIYLATVYGNWLGKAGQTVWVTFTIVLITGIASWCLCAITLIIRVFFPVPDDIQQNKPRDKTCQILAIITTVATLLISLPLLLLSLISAF